MSLLMRILPLKKRVSIQKGQFLSMMYFCLLLNKFYLKITSIFSDVSEVEMSYKAITKESYDATAEQFTCNVADLAPVESIQKFIDLLPPKARIIDIGCGSGRDAKLFTENGLSVLGIDFSQSLINIAKINAPLAEFQEMDIETAIFPASSFEGAWACCSLSHITKKVLPYVLKNIHSLLKPDGYFYLSVKKGSGEGLAEDLRYGNIKKFWSFFEEDELKKYLQMAHFKILDCRTVEKTSPYHTHPGIRVFCQK